VNHVLIAISRLHCMDGIASQLATLLPALRRQGWVPHFVVGMIDCPPENRPTLDRIQSAADSFDVQPLLSCQHGPGPRVVWQQARMLRGLCEQHACGVIHLRGRALSPAVSLCRFISGIRCVNVPPLAPDLRRGLMRSWLLRRSGRFLADRVIAISADMLPHLKDEWGVPETRLRVVCHGSELGRFRPPTEQERRERRVQLGLNDEGFVCVQLARVGSIKRPDTVLRAIARLTAEGRDVTVLFAGHCIQAEREKVGRLAEELGIRDRVHILGHVDARDVLWASDVKVLASEREGFGIAVVEAMACGVVPVRTPVEGATDQIDDGVNGLLFPVGDDAALADHLRFLMDHPDQRRRMGEAAQRKAIERFSDDAMARGTIRVYEELVNSKGSRCACC